MNLLVFLKKYFYLFIWLCWVLVVAHKIFDLCCDTWSKWDLVPRPGIKPRPPALGACTLSHWTTRKFPLLIS